MTRSIAAIIILFILLVCLLAWPTASQAEDKVFYDDFNDGFAGWTADPGVTSENDIYYWDSPNAVRIEGAAKLWRTVSTAGYENIAIHWHVLGGYLEANESCQVQVNSGSGWSTIAAVVNGQDDWYYRSGWETLGAAADDNAGFQIRFRGSANNEYTAYDWDICYVDDITIIGTPIGEETIYFDDFDDGFTGWTADSGVYSVDNAYYWTNPNAVQIRGAAKLWRAVSTSGYSGVKVTWHVLGGYLEANESCQVQVNSGSGWSTVAAVVNGEDDWYYRWDSEALDPAADDNASFQIRFRGSANNEFTGYDYDYCYVDDVRISGVPDGGGGTPTPTPTATIPAGGVPGDPLTGSGSVNRSLLTYSDLTTLNNPSAPVDDSAFALPAAAAHPDYNFEGSLVLQNEANRGGYSSIRDDYNIGNLDPGWKHIPEFDFEFVQNGSHLIPVERGLYITNHIGWDYLLGPGRVWKENGDNGYSRAAFPFALIEKNANCAHNGVMTFLFTDTAVSNVRYQITQETCQYHKFNMWGELNATYTPGTVSGSDQIETDYAQEVSDKLPAASFSQLTTDYPGTDLSQFGYGLTPEHITTQGLLIDGTLYVDSCDTRYGEYAFCENMALPSYSTAKSAFASAALMALAQDYGSGVADLLIKDYVPEAATAVGNWNSVTFNHTSDMATGNYDSATYPDDEAGSTLSDFFLALSDADKRDYAFSFPYKSAPGTQFVYHTSDTYILTQALDQYLQSQQGSGADIFDYLVSEVLQPIKIGPGSQTTLRTIEVSGRGQPFGGYGLFWTHDAIAKMGNFLLNDGGAAGGSQVLHSGLLAAAMQQDPNDRGVDADGFQYNNGFWGLDFGPAEGYSCTFWTPFMSGYGGISVVMMPNGAVYYVFSDNGEFEWETAVSEANEMIPHCP